MASESPPPKPSPSRLLGTQALHPLTSKLSATASLLPHSVWRPYSCPDLSDGNSVSAPSIYGTLYLPSFYLGP